jgi:hypothetical protein
MVGTIAVPTTQVALYPVANRSYGQILFLGSTINTPLSTSSPSYLNVSNIVAGTQYNFGFNGCYQ